MGARRNREFQRTFAVMEASEDKLVGGCEVSALGVNNVMRSS